MELPREIAVMTLPSAILFPQALLPLYIFEPRYRRMLAEALDTHRMFSVAMQRPGRTREAPCSVAGLGLIRASVGRKDGTSNLILQGITRVELEETVRYKPYRVHRFRPIASAVNDSVAIDALTIKVLELASERLDYSSELPLGALKHMGHLKETVPGPASQGAVKRPGKEIFEELSDPEQIADLVSYTLLPSPLERQLLLETIDLETRLKHLIHFLIAENRRQRDRKSK